MFEGADPRTTDSNGNTVLHTAARHGHYHLVEVFLNDGCADLLRSNEPLIILLTRANGHVLD